MAATDQPEPGVSPPTTTTPATTTPATTTPGTTTPGTTTPGTETNATLEAQLLQALSQGGGGGSIGQQQNPLLVAQPTSSGVPGVIYIGLAAAAGVIIFLLAKRKG